MGVHSIEMRYITKISSIAEAPIPIANWPSEDGKQLTLFNHQAVLLPMEPVTSSGRLQTISTKGSAMSRDHVNGTLYRLRRLFRYSAMISFRMYAAVVLYWSYHLIRVSSVFSSRMSWTYTFSIISVVSWGED